MSLYDQSSFSKRSQSGARDLAALFAESSKPKCVPTFVMDVNRSPCGLMKLYVVRPVASDVRLRAPQPSTRDRDPPADSRAAPSLERVSVSLYDQSSL